MEASAAYSALVKELETIRQLPARELVVLAGGPAIEQIVDLAGERVELEILVTWRDSTHSAVRIAGHARGPSTWHHEHLQESITVAIPPGATNGA